MKNKISTFVTGFPDSVIGDKKNRKKRKEKMSSNPDDDNILLKRKKYLSIDAKPNVRTTIPQVPAINDKIIKEKKKEILATSTHSYCIKDIAVKNLKEKPNTADIFVSEIEKFAEPSSFPTSLPLFSSLKSKFNSPLPQLIKQRSTSTPIAGSEGQEVYFNMEPLTPIKELIEISSSLPKQQTNIKRVVISELPSPPIISIPKNKHKSTTSEKLKLGILNCIPKFCPFCDYVCERMISHHIQTAHCDKLKMPISTSVDGINKIITNFAKNKKILMPLQYVVNIMGDYWFNPEIRKIGNILCNLGQITTYGGSWELNHVPEVSNPFEQYIVASKLQSE